MVAVLFPSSSFPGEVPAEAAGRLTNAMADPVGPGKRTAAVVKRVCGITPFANSTQAGFRDGAVLDGTLYAAFHDNLCRINSDQTVTILDSLSGSGYVGFAANNAASPDRVLVSEDGAFIIDPADGTLSPYPDEDLLQPTDVVSGFNFLFFLIANGTIQSTNIGTTDIDSNNFVTAEAKPDSLLRGGWLGDNLYAFGTETIEVLGPPINDSAFPLNRITVIPRGLLAKRALTGYQDGFAKGIHLIGDDGLFYRLDGYSPVAIRHPDLERAISRLADKSTLRLSSFVVDGRAQVQIASSKWTWIYDLGTGTFFERRSRINDVQLPYWRSAGAIKAFDRWLVADTETGNIGSLSGTEPREFNDLLVWEVESLSVDTFPRGMTVREANFNMAVGFGRAGGAQPHETDPHVDVSWSDDDGNTWAQWRRVGIGRQGEFLQKVPLHLTGRTQHKGRRWRLRVSSPLYVSLMGGEMIGNVRAG